MNEQELYELAETGNASVKWHDIPEHEGLQVGVCTWADGQAHGVSCQLQQRLADLFFARLPSRQVVDAVFPAILGQSWVLDPVCWQQPDRYSPPMPATDIAGLLCPVDHNDGLHAAWLVRGPDSFWSELPADRHPNVPRLKRIKPQAFGPRALRFGMRGDDVSEVQRKLGLDVTGAFDHSVVRAVEQFQKETGLAKTGYVNKETRDRLFDSAPLQRIPSAAKRVLARNFTPGRTEPIRVVCLHHVASPSAAEIANIFADLRRAPHASVHYVLGEEGDTYECVPERHTAWGAPGCNSYAIHVVVVGDADPQPLVDDICARNDIIDCPLEAEGLLASGKGIVTHQTVRDALALAEQRCLLFEPWFNQKYGVFRKDRSCLRCCDGSFTGTG